MDSKGSFYREGSIYVANDKKSCICDGELKTRGGTSINLPLLKWSCAAVLLIYCHIRLAVLQTLLTLTGGAGFSTT